jgi:ribosomal protein S1
MGEPEENIKPADFFFEGQSVKVRILQVNSARQRLGLSLVLD